MIQKKALDIYKPGDVWYNELELAAFEANLTNELQSIADDISNNTCSLQPIQPVAYPKGVDDDGRPHTFIVKGHGGNIAVDSKENEFTAFVISLPIV